MTEFDTIIEQLERQKEAIDQALSALRGGRVHAERPRRGRPPGTAAKKERKKRVLTEEGRRKLAEGMRKRWALKRAAAKKSAKR